MYLIFPDNYSNGLELLQLRRELIFYSEQNNIPHNVYVENNEFRVRLTQKQHYTQFALQWEYSRFYIVPGKIAA